MATAILNTQQNFPLKKKTNSAKLENGVGINGVQAESLIFGMLLRIQHGAGPRNTQYKYTLPVMQNISGFY
jgi:hypothetical protein